MPLILYLNTELFVFNSPQKNILKIKCHKNGIRKPELKIKHKTKNKEITNRYKT